MDNIPVIIQIVSLLVTIATQVCLLAYFWGKFSEKVDNLKEDRNEIMAGIKDMGRSMYNLTMTVNEHGKKIQALETWRDMITPNVHTKRNGSNG